MTCIGLTELVFFLGSSASFGTRNILVVCVPLFLLDSVLETSVLTLTPPRSALGGLWAVHLYIFSIVHTCEARKRGSFAAQKVRRLAVRLSDPFLGADLTFSFRNSALFDCLWASSCRTSSSPGSSSSPTSSRARRTSATRGTAATSASSPTRACVLSSSLTRTYVRLTMLHPQDVIGLVLMALAFLVEIGAWYGKLRFDLRRRDTQPGSTSHASSSVLSHGIYVRPPLAHRCSTRPSDALTLSLFVPSRRRSRATRSSSPSRSSRSASTSSSRRLPSTPGAAAACTTASSRPAERLSLRASSRRSPSSVRPLTSVFLQLKVSRAQLIEGDCATQPPSSSSSSPGSSAPSRRTTARSPRTAPRPPPRATSGPPTRCVPSLFSPFRSPSLTRSARRPQVYRSRTSPIVPLPSALYACLPAGAKRYFLGERTLDATAARRLGAREAETVVEC